MAPQDDDAAMQGSLALRPDFLMALGLFHKVSRRST